MLKRKGRLGGLFGAVGAALLLAAVVGCAGRESNGGGGRAEREPNNDSSEATLLGTEGEFEVSGDCGGADSYDWFQVNPVDGSFVTISLQLDLVPVETAGMYGFWSEQVNGGGATFLEGFAGSGYELSADPPIEELFLWFSCQGEEFSYSGLLTIE